MGKYEPVPPKTYAERVMRNIRAVGPPSEDNPDEVDISTAALTDQPLDNNFLAAATRQVHYVGLGMSLELPGILIDQYKELVEQRFDYHEIFVEFIQRREERESKAPTARMKDLVSKWLLSIEANPDPVHEIGEPPNLGDLFKDMVRDHLPKKLGFNSWVGRIAFTQLAEMGAITTGELVMWQSWMGTATVPVSGAHAFTLKGYKTFLGGGGEGRPVWRENQLGVFQSERNVTREKHRIIEDLIRASEESLISLSAQIANWLAYSIIDSHAESRAHGRDRRGLNGYDIVMAVVEILGDEWFELPFDDKGRLQEWKLRRSLFMDLDDYFHILEG